MIKEFYDGIDWGVVGSVLWHTAWGWASIYWARPYLPMGEEISLIGSLIIFLLLSTLVRSIEGVSQ